MMSKWKKIRIGLLTLVALFSFFLPLESQEEPIMHWNELAIIFLLIPIALLFVIGIQAFNPLSAKVWEKPNWDVNFLNFADPVQFFHFGAYVMLVQGIITLCRVPLTKGPFNPENLMPLVRGAGVLLGLQVTKLVFRSKFIESPKPITKAG